MKPAKLNLRSLKKTEFKADHPPEWNDGEIIAELTESYLNIFTEWDEIEIPRSRLVGFINWLSGNLNGKIHSSGKFNLPVLYSKSRRSNGKKTKRRNRSVKSTSRKLDR